jgi:hypothetical protein
LKPFYKFSARAVSLAVCFCFCLPGPAQEVSSGPDPEKTAAAAESGDAESHYTTGLRFYNGSEGAAKDYVKAVEWFQKAADKGHAKAQAYLGYIYVTVPGISTNPAEGFTWLRRAAEMNEVSAQYDLGTFYEKGRGVPPDRFEAMDWYMKAAAQGHRDAKEDIERLRRTADAASKGLVPDEWWMIPFDELIQKAEQGDAEAQYNLGRRYRGYGGTAVDIEKSMEWLEKAAAQTNQAARYSLSQLYVSTTNIIPEKAFYHCSIAAEGGYVTAQRVLGKYYRDGFGTVPDRAQALHWLCLAEQSGDDSAGSSIYSMIKGHAKFKGVSSVEMVIRDLDNQERTVKFIKYDPKKKQVQTDYQFGTSALLPLSAFAADSYPVIQNAWKKKVLENGLRLDVEKKILSRKDCEELGFIGGDSGPSKYRYDGAVYQLKFSNRDDFLVLRNLDIESRVYSLRKEQWAGAYGKTGPPKEIQNFAKKSFKVKELQTGSECEFETDPLVVESYSTLGNYYKQGVPTELDSKILGLCVRVSCEMADGTTFYRDFYEPSALKSKTIW